MIGWRSIAKFHILSPLLLAPAGWAAAARAQPEPSPAPPSPGASGPRARDESATAENANDAARLGANTSAEPRAEPPPPAAPDAAPAARPPRIVPPVARHALEVPYPEGAEGEASVVLELLVSETGSVGEAVAIEGQEPFASAATEAALGWQFEPARREGQAMAARIRVGIRFSPPVFELEEVPLPPEPAPGGGEAPVQNEPPPSFEVLVVGQRVVGVKKLGRGEVRQMPGAFGDPYRAIESLPGVTPIVSGLPYFFVRGAPPGNVGYLFDWVTVPLLYHVAAGPGVIHPAFIKSVDLYSGAYPAKYGRFAGGIVAGEPQDPRGALHGEASVRLVDAGAFLEVPFDEGRGSAMIAGRYSYTGLIVSLLASDVSVGYWDYQAKISHDISPGNTLSLFAFGSHDFLAADDQAGQRRELLDLTFHRLVGSYDHALLGGGSLTVSAMAGLDRTGLGGDPDDPDASDVGNLTSRSLGARLLYDQPLSPALVLRAGGDLNFSRVGIALDLDQDFDQEEDGRIRVRRNIVSPAPGFPELLLEPLEEAEDELDRATADLRFPSRDDLVGGAWLEAQWEISRGITVTPGLRLDLYRTGDSLSVAPEPRLTARFDVAPGVSLTHAIGLAHQPPSFAIPLPGLSAVADEGLQRAVQSSAGVELELPWKLSATATLFQNATFDSTDIFGTARLQGSTQEVSAFSDRTTNHSYGLELYLKRSLTEKLGGFIAYTLSRSRRSVARLTGPSSFDRSHVLNLALAYDLGNRFRLGARAVAYSGIPSEVAYAEAAQRPPRSPWFYRLDWRLEKRWAVGTAGAWWAVVAEVLNTTLNPEALDSSCYAYGCQVESTGPVTIPSLGVEASF